MPWSLVGRVSYREEFCSCTLDIGSNHAGGFNDCFARVFDYIYFKPLGLVHTLARSFCMGWFVQYWMGWI
jgi:hypothetical protein